MAATPPPTTGPRVKLRLGELLLKAGVVSDVQLKAALAEQRKWGGKLGRTLVDMGFVNEEIMAKALARQLGLPLVNLAKDMIPGHVTQHLGVDLAERFGIFPVGADAQKRVLQVATSDPTAYDALDELAFRTNCRIEVFVAAPSDIDRAIRKHYYGDSTSSPNIQAPEGAGDGPAMEVEHLTGAASAASNPTGTWPMRPPPEPIAAPPPVVTPPPRPAPSKTPPPLSTPTSPADLAALRDITAQIQRLEQALAGEVRALRGLVELLLERGVIDREAYVNKVRGPGFSSGFSSPGSNPTGPTGSGPGGSGPAKP